MILVTAAGGKTGRHILSALRQRGEPVRALARTPAIHALRANGVETLHGDMLNPEVLAHALDGVQAVVHTGPALHPQEVAMGQAVVDAMITAGIPRLVLMSVYHPQLDFLVNHQAKLRVENAAVSSGLDYTILQPMHYMQNVDPNTVIQDGVFTLPYSLTTPLSFVDLGDVAEVVGIVLGEDGHVHATYPLCGTDLLTGQEVADRIAARSGIAVGAREAPLGTFVAAITRHHPLPGYTIDSLYRLFSYYGLHAITGNPNVLRWLLGREPTTFHGYIDRCLSARDDCVAVGVEQQPAANDA